MTYEIEISAEMVDAGKTALRKYRDKLGYPDGVTVEEIYRAMHSHRPPPFLTITKPE